MQSQPYLTTDYMERWNQERERREETHRRRMAGVRDGKQPRNREELVTSWLFNHHGYGKDCGNMSYRGAVLISYATPIAYVADGDVYVSVERYSASTSSQISIVQSVLVSNGYVLLRRDATTERPSKVYGGWLRDSTPFQHWVKRDSYAAQDNEYNILWTSPNGIWQIIRNEHPTGRDIYPYIVTQWDRYPVAYVRGSGDAWPTGSTQIPVYVRRALTDIIKEDEHGDH